MENTLQVHFTYKCLYRVDPKQWRAFQATFSISVNCFSVFSGQQHLRTMLKGGAQACMTSFVGSELMLHKLSAKMWCDLSSPATVNPLKCDASRIPGAIHLVWLFLMRASGTGAHRVAPDGNREPRIPPEGRESSNFLVLLYLEGHTLKPPAWSCLAPWRSPERAEAGVEPPSSGCRCLLETPRGLPGESGRSDMSL